LVLLAAASLAFPAADAPVPDGEVVATVNGEAITVADLFAQLGSMHMGVTEPAGGVKPPDPAGLLDRLIDVKMVVQEARNIGLDELPDFTRRVERLRLDTLRSELSRRAIAGVTEGDRAEAERLFRDEVRELEIDSLLFANPDDARSFVAAVGAGADFAGAAGEAVAAGTAVGGGARSVKVPELRPEVARILLDMKPGQVSAPVPLPGGATVVKLLGVRYPESAGERDRARSLALRMKQQAILQETMARWRDEYTEVDRALLDTLDYDVEATALDKLRRDERTVARVKGSGPVTVGELTAGVERKFFHGLESAGKRGGVNAELPGILDRILLERVAKLESGRPGIEAGGEFREAVRRGEERLLFEIFVERVINPDVKLSEEELKRYYQEHTADYRSQEMIRIDGLAFAARDAAQAALDKLRRGADFGWMRENAPGRAGREEFDELLEFDGRPLLTGALPQGIRDAVAGAGSDEYRFYGDSGGPSYVLLVREVIPAQAAPYDSVRTDISHLVYARKRQAIVEEWTAKLRAASEIEVLATVDQLKRRLGLGIADIPSGEPPN
jgi:hypothetical protein